MTSRLAGLATALVLLLCATASAADPTWHLQLDAGDGFGLNDVSCASPTLCIGVGESGVAAIEEGSYLYNERPEASASFNAISCVPGDRFCVAVDNQGKVVQWVDGHFGDFTSPLAGTLEPKSISCVNRTFCMVIDNQDNTYQYTGSSWTKRTLTKPGSGNVQTKVSCVTASFCVAVTGATDGMRYAIWSGSGWTDNTSKIDTDAADPRSLICTASNFCLVTTNHGKAGKYGGTSWTTTQVVTGGYPLVASCAGGTCRAMDQNVNTYTSTDGVAWTPAGNPKATSLLSAPSAIFCQAADLCVATSSSDASVFGPSIIPTTKPVASGSGHIGQPISVAYPPIDEKRAWFANYWERCSQPGSGCVRIEGANGASYTPTNDDAGSYLEARVSSGVLLDEEGAADGNSNFVSNNIHIDDLPAPAATVTATPTPAPTASPSPTPAKPAAAKLKGKIKTSKTKVSIPLTCAVACSGKVTLSKVGSANYAIAAGKAKTVSIKLGKKARKALKKRHKLKVTLTIAPKGGKAVKSSVTLKR